MIYAGIDAGSRTIKAVLFEDGRRAVLAEALLDQGVDQEARARRCLETALAQAGVGWTDVAGRVATGYGRAALGFADTTITEITCHACGVAHHAPHARTVIEIGGQDSKLIRLEAGGRVRDFAMNDRCAAGTGRFLEILAARLEVDLVTLGDLAARSGSPTPISSMCVVFAETEIVGLLAQGTPRPDIAAGVQQAIASRVAGMAGRQVEDPVFFTGGVALQAGMIRALEHALARPVRIPLRPQFTGALGAALLAARRAASPA